MNFDKDTYQHKQKEEFKQQLLNRTKENQPEGSKSPLERFINLALSYTQIKQEERLEADRNDMEVSAKVNAHKKKFYEELDKGDQV